MREGDGDDDPMQRRAITTEPSSGRSIECLTKRECPSSQRPARPLPCEQRDRVLCRGGCVDNNRMRLPSELLRPRSQTGLAAQMGDVDVCEPGSASICVQRCPYAPAPATRLPRHGEGGVARSFPGGMTKQAADGESDGGASSSSVRQVQKQLDVLVWPPRRLGPLAKSSARRR